MSSQEVYINAKEKVLRSASIVVLLLCLLQNAKAQDTDRRPIQELYDRETIYLISPNRYVRNNIEYTGSAQLRREFMLSPGGMQLYSRSQRNRNIALVVSLVGSAGTIYTLASGNRDFYRPFFILSLGTGLASGLLNIRANTQLNQAVWLRNRDAMSLSEIRK
ncbi:hypothetical protein [Persicitalea jodogahamensis]|uniref:Uncharacterized protein n=1 Tax=Persicitalea jodogahamensis TaxID=402147 RepID=A0A8J3D0R8_9BACT|nr:hypothetical protein [Persicitalea jodogahamensis]GHB52940.1 hypothetical protein GCM10007390_02020 [Persicitalea jodogahamensis]